MGTEPIFSERLSVLGIEYQIEIIREFLKNKVLSIVDGNDSHGILPNQKVDAIDGIKFIPANNNGVKIIIKTKDILKIEKVQESIYDFEIDDVQKATLEIYPGWMIVVCWPEPAENIISSKIVKHIYFGVEKVEKVDGEQYSFRDLGIGDKFSFPKEFSGKENGYCRVWEKIEKNKARLYVIESTEISKEIIQIDEEDKVIYCIVYGI